MLEGLDREKARELVKQRDLLREQQAFAQADKIRKELEQMGYEVIDTPQGTNIVPANAYQKPKKNFLALFGSGESSDSGVKIHSYVMDQMGKDEISVALISTPAGFQPNVEGVYSEIVDFFAQHLVNYHPKIQVIWANNLKDANNPELLKPLESADYIFTGPGSPTYALRHLTGTLLLEKMRERVRNGASLALASAATIAFSRFALPVYEIYKAGSPLYWEHGLNFYKEFAESMTIIPHWNTREGGKKFDTSRAWMGKQQFEKLMAKLPADEKVFGIDEHTAMIVDLQSKEVTSMGKGKVTQVF